MNFVHPLNSFLFELYIYYSNRIFHSIQTFYYENFVQVVCFPTQSCSLERYCICIRFQTIFFWFTCSVPCFPCYTCVFYCSIHVSPPCPVLPPVTTPILSIREGFSLLITRTISRAPPVAVFQVVGHNFFWWGVLYVQIFSCSLFPWKINILISCVGFVFHLVTHH